MKTPSGRVATGYLPVFIFLLIAVVLALPSQYPSAANSTKPSDGGITSPLREVFSNYINRAGSTALALQSESVTLYAADCATPKSAFSLGETVCAKTDGVDVETNPGNYYMNWVDSQLNQTNGGTITQNPQFFLFVPPTAGSWKATIGRVDPADVSIVGNPPIFTVSGTSPGISTFATNCTTPKTAFALGQTVCATAVGGVAAPRRIVWIDPSGNARQVNSITADPQNFSFAIPSDPTTDIGGVMVDNRGTWKVNMISSRGSAVATTTFVVSDPQNPAADVGIVKSGGGDISAGSSGAFVILVYNNGPDDATNVTLTDPLPSQLNFFALSQTGSPTFTCQTPASGSSGTVTCTVASMPAKSRATIQIAFDVASGTAAGTDITNTATVSATSTDNNSENNSSTASVHVPSGGGGSGTCTVACPDDIQTPANTTDGNGNPGAIVHFSPPSGNLSCGTVTADHCNDCFFPQGSTVVTGTAADTGDSCSFTVTVTPPSTGTTTVSCPANQTADADSNCKANVSTGTATGTGTNLTIYAVRSDGEPMYTCDNFGNCTRVGSDAPFTYGVTTITWYAFSHDVAGPYTGPVDAEGNPVNDSDTEEGHRTSSASCTQTVTVNDVTTPTIAATDQTASADANCQAPVPDYSSTVTDNCSSSVTYTQTPAAGTLVGLGPNTVHIEANDGSSNNGGAGNTSTKDVTFTVNDTTAPTVQAPADSSASADANCQAPVPDYTGGSTASDNCDGSVTLTQSPAAGTLVGSGPHTVTVTATDDAGNQGSDDVIFTVNDTTPPTVQAPADSSASADANCQAAVPDYTANSTASDNCDTSLSLTQSPAAGTMVGLGPHTVTVTATDDAGNQSSDDVVFTVNDTTAPQITCPANITTGNDPGMCYATVNPGTATATDNCDNSVTIVGTRSDGQPLNSSYPKGTTTIHWTATDDANNTSSCDQTVTVNDTEPPAISCPANITKNNDPGVCGAVVTYTAPVGTDNCAGATTVQTAGLPSGSTFPVGTTTNTFKVTDASGNSTSCSFTVTVNDVEAPSISCPSSQTLEPTCPSGAVATWTPPVGTDNCPGATTTRTAGPAPGSTFPVGTTTVTYTVNDAHGNSTSCSFTVTVKTVNQTILDMEAYVNSLGNLSGVQKQGLNAKLEQARTMIIAGQINSACNKLNDFISQVQAYIKNGTLTAAQGNTLITSANHVRNAIGCTSNPCS